VKILKNDDKITARQDCYNCTCWIWSWSRTSLWTTGRFFFLMADTTGSNQSFANTFNLISKQHGHYRSPYELSIISRVDRLGASLIESLLYRPSVISLSTWSRSSSTIVFTAMSNRAEQSAPGVSSLQERFPLLLLSIFFHFCVRAPLCFSDVSIR